jgi:hypothetical protein
MLTRPQHVSSQHSAFSPATVSKALTVQHSALGPATALTRIVISNVR